jgi:ketosteroid isomerase-like protein
VSVAGEKNKALVRRFYEALTEGELDTMGELLAPDFVDHSLLPGQEPGREGYKQSVAYLLPERRKAAGVFARSRREKGG